MSAKTRRVPISHDKSSEESSLYYVRMKKKLDDNHSSTSIKPTEAYKESAYENEPQESACKTESVNEASTILHTSYKIPKKKIQPRFPPGFHDAEDKRSQGLRVQSSDLKEKPIDGTNDPLRLSLSYQASQDKIGHDDGFKLVDKKSSDDESKIKLNKKTRRRKKIEMRQRHANQLLLRGEFVVLISALDQVPVT